MLAARRRSRTRSRRDRASPAPRTAVRRRPRPPTQVARHLLEDADEELADDLALLARGRSPLRARRSNRSAAFTCTRSTSNWRRKVSSTWSASPARISPVSTNTQVSWSPTALCTSAAATAESTPPDSAAEHPLGADLRPHGLDLLLDDRHVRPGRGAARTRRSGSGRTPRRRGRCAPPRGGTATRRAVARGRAWPQRGAPGEVAVATKPGGTSVIASPWLIHTETSRASRGRAARRRRLRATATYVPYSPWPVRDDRAAELQRHAAARP